MSNAQITETDDKGNIVRLNHEGTWFKIGDLICGTKDFEVHFGCRVIGRIIRFPLRNITDSVRLIEAMHLKADYIHPREHPFYRVGDKHTTHPHWFQLYNEAKPIPRRKGKDILNINQPNV